jgi:hypothetical protein
MKEDEQFGDYKREGVVEMLEMLEMLEMFDFIL